MLSLSQMCRSVLILCFLFVLSGQVFSQIIITADDILSVRGKTFLSKTDTTIKVDVGASGGNKFWDFSSVGMFNPPNFDTCKANPACLPYTKLEYFAADTTLFFKDFPRANLVQKITFAPAPDSVLYNYFLAKDSLLNLGTGLKLGSLTPFVLLRWRNEKPLGWPLPLEFGKRWSTQSYADFFVFGFPIGFISISSSSIVDAWGTISLPTKTFLPFTTPCLRICSQDTTIININVYRDTLKTINYTWVSPQYYSVATAASKDGETNPTFTVASGFQRVTDVKDKSGSAEIPTPFVLSQNFPNPFNPITTIRYGLPTAERVTLRIYDLLGEEVATLVNDEQQSAGHRAAIWDGRNNDGKIVASGVYIYRIRAGSFTLTKKLALMK